MLSSPTFLACKTGIQMVLPAAVLEALRQLAPGGFEDRLAHQVLCEGAGRLGRGRRSGQVGRQKRVGTDWGSSPAFLFPSPVTSGMSIV